MTVRVQHAFKLPVLDARDHPHTGWYNVGVDDEFEYDRGAV